MGGEDWRSLMSACTRILPGSPRDLSMCKGPTVSVQRLPFWPRSAALAVLGASMPETAQGGGEKSRAASLPCDPKQAPSLLRASVSSPLKWE